jgi:hypothetical protein
MSIGSAWWMERGRNGGFWQLLLSAFGGETEEVVAEVGGPKDRGFPTRP